MFPYAFSGTPIALISYKGRKSVSFITRIKKEDMISQNKNITTKAIEKFIYLSFSDVCYASM